MLLCSDNEDAGAALPDLAEFLKENKVVFSSTSKLEV